MIETLHEILTSSDARDSQSVQARLEDETSAVMLGFMQTSEFSESLQTTLSIEKEKADAIAKDISDLLFTKIRDAMKALYETSKNKAEQVPDQPKKSVVMPSATSPAPTPPAVPKIAPVTPPKPVTSVPAPVPAATAAPKVPEIHAADLMLSEPTMSMPPKAAPTIPAPASPTPPKPAAPTTPAAPVTPSKPAPYKQDPYREPPE